VVVFTLVRYQQPPQGLLRGKKKASRKKPLFNTLSASLKPLLGERSEKRASIELLVWDSGKPISSSQTVYAKK